MKWGRRVGGVDDSDFGSKWQSLEKLVAAVAHVWADDDDTAGRERLWSLLV